MSSYLNLYLKPKDSDKKLRFSSTSRSSNVYNCFYENGVAYIGHDEDNESYTEVTTDYLNDILSDLDTDIKKWEKRIAEYRKHADGDTEIIEEILTQEEYLQEVNNTRQYISFLKDIVYDIEQGYTSFDGMYANVD